MADAEGHAKQAKRVFFKNCRYLSILGDGGKCTGEGRGKDYIRHPGKGVFEYSHMYVFYKLSDSFVRWDEYMLECLCF